MKKVNIVLITIASVFILFTLFIWGNVGIIRDEYNITGGGTENSYMSLFWILGEAIGCIILNGVALAKKVLHKKTNLFIITASTVLLIVSGIMLMSGCIRYRQMIICSKYLLKLS